jgi:hypothetical protein
MFGGVSLQQLLIQSVGLDRLACVETNFLVTVLGIYSLEYNI